jgi:hypothetical protein
MHKKAYAIVYSAGMGSTRTVLEDKILTALNLSGLGLGLESADTLSTGAVEAGTEKHVPAI